MSVERRVALYTDGTPVLHGDRIRYHQAPGGLIPPGPWREGVAALWPGRIRNPAEWLDPAELYLYDDGHFYWIVGHVVERLPPPDEAPAG